MGPDDVWRQHPWGVMGDGTILDTHGAGREGDPATYSRAHNSRGGETGLEALVGRIIGLIGSTGTLIGAAALWFAATGVLMILLKAGHRPNGRHQGDRLARKADLVVI